MKSTENFKCIFFNNIHGLESENIELLLSEKYHLIISHEEKKINKFFNPHVINIVGRAQLELGLSLKKFVWTEFDYPKEENYELIHAWFLRTSTIISNAFWIVKDNSIRFNTGHLSYFDDKSITVKSNTTHSQYSNCLGKKNITNFNNNEIIEALNYFDFLFGITLNKENGELDHTSAEANRINRAYYYIDLARKSYDIGTKVSLHCSAFECLFSVDNIELSHRLSETVAYFLGENFERRKEIYKQMKEIYGLRSTVTHGSGIKKELFKNNEENLNRIGINCDSLMRNCIRKIIANENLKKLYFENNTENIRVYFIDLVLS
ncbi:HEPN domain-containing protein [Flavobacterium sp.]|uniref:HEPN domain-containing protein n=1 Tax=Flavobacterium sp. TaxID=239 RepID=UPI0008BC59E1|nr:HEPN domain-containing protein [Flavobacterium sp.]OGS62340.1 MAG: hypothetical protein A2X07_00420 [Flavobacteria bacterium GWF1_32_7]HBD25775.1 hypothetical protein [Flavobacterium sp.]